MKPILLGALLFAATSAYGGCLTTLEQAVESVRADILTTLPESEHKFIKDVRVRVRPLPNDVVGAVGFIFHHRVLTLDPSMCLAHPAVVDAVIAHEFGHLVADSRDEDEADAAGAKLLSNARREEILASINTECEQDRKWFCKFAVSFKAQ